MTYWIEEATNSKEYQSEVLSFSSYFEKLKDNPERELRPTCKYLLDMINFFGKDEDQNFKLFSMDNPDSPAVFGQQVPEQAILENLINFLEEGINNKFILLVGPNGSSKSSIVKKMMKGAEIYSETEEGSLYTFSWIFPIENYVKGSLGLANIVPQENLSTFAHLDDKDISAIIGSELKDHPLLLIPKLYRQKLIDELFPNNQTLLKNIKKSYLYKGDLSKKNKMIYDALLKNFKGNHQEVLKHIRIERISISKRYSTSAVTIEPQIHLDARMQQISMDKRLASLPPSLQCLNLFSLQGEIVMANRGILEYSDLLKRPLDTYKYLLMTMETGTINIQGILTELDTFFIGTSNEIHLAAFKQHPDFNSFKGRFNFIKVPYLLNFEDEESIYCEQVNSLKEKTSFEPHALSTLCLFAIMSRLRVCQSKNYPNKKLSNIVTSLNPLEKSLLLSNGKLPRKLDIESKQVLKHNIEEVRNEFQTENLYEGKFGLSPRDLKAILYQLSSLHKRVTFIEVIEFLSKLILQKNDYDFLNMTPQGDFHNPVRFISLLKNYNLDSFDHELRESLGLVDNRSYEDYVKKYIQNINAFIKGEKLKNKITGKFEDCDVYFIKEFENNITLEEEPEKFRAHLISKLGAFALDNPNKEIVYSTVFPNLIQKLQESFRNEQKSFIQDISKTLVFYEAHLEKMLGAQKESHPEEKSQKNLSQREISQITLIIENLQKNFQYTKEGAISILRYVIKERY